MVLYWRGKLSLTDQNGLLARFYAKASQELWAYTLAFVGRRLMNEGREVPEVIIERMKALWTNRLAAARATGNAEQYVEEIASFGWWVASEKFDNEWTLLQLADALKVAKKIDPAHLVVERLAKLSRIMPGRTVECLDLIIDGDQEGWSKLTWRESARTILAEAINSADEHARSIAIAIIHRLGARGYFEFRQLLNPRTL
jgi:hypothetical protein